MYLTILNQIAEQRSRLLETIELCRHAVGQIMTPSGTFPSLETELPDAGLTIGQIHIRATLITEMLKPVIELTPSAMLSLPLSKFTPIVQSLTALAGKFESLAEQIRIFGDFVAADETGFVLSSPDKTKSINLSHEYSEIIAKTEAALCAAFDAAHVLENAPAPKLGDAVELIGVNLSKITDTEYNIGLAKERIEKNDEKINQLAESVEKKLQEIEERQSKIEDLASQAEQAVQNIDSINEATQKKSTETLTQINKINATADEVRTEVEEYEENFKKFDEALASREREISEGSKNLQNLAAALKAKDETAGKLIAEAKEALGWTTVQGLSLSFSTSADQLEEPLRRATNDVYFSMLFFAIWVLGVFVIVPWFDPSLRLLSTPDHLQGWAVPLHILTNLGVRLTIIAPALLLLLFSMSRYRNFSALRDQYQFKKTIAAAIPGFKEQAAAQEDPHAKAMTLAAFERLLFNPVDPGTKNFDGRGGGGWLSRQLVRIVAKAISEAQRQTGS